MRVKNLYGNVYGRLEVISQPIQHKGKIYYDCRCSCGKITRVRADSLTKGSTRSCGCLFRDAHINTFYKINIFKDGTQPSKIGAKTVSNKSGVVGVNWDKARGKWQASIRFRHKKYNLGRFSTIKEAKEAREQAEEKLLKEYEWYNNLNKKR